MQNESRTLKPGDVVDGRYEIVNRIGRGGFATVYRSKHIQLDRPAALKILDPITSGTSENFIERFLSEARIVANLRHPNVVMIYDFGVVKEDQPYIAMDLLEGHDLETELMNHGPIQPERAIKLFLGVLDALNEGHLKQIVHKDLKPSNLFLVHPRTDREKLIVLDYGIARVADSDAPRLTQTGGYTGTPAYMPPEYIRESIVSPTNDVYQIGLILIEVMTGDAVIDEKTSIACMVAHLGGQRNIADWIQQSTWGPILEKALEIDHTKRFQNAGEFMDAIRLGEIPVVPRIQTLNGNVGSRLAEPSLDGTPGLASNYAPYPAVVVPPPSTAELPASPVVNTEPLASYSPHQKNQMGGVAYPNVQSENMKESALDGYARIEAKSPKKSKLIWILGFLFIGFPMLIVAIFLTVIYGYYGGFTEYGEALNKSLTSEISQESFPSQGDDDDSASSDIVSKYLNEQPNADVSKIHFFLSARYMAYNLHHQLEMFDVSVQNHGYENKEDLVIPTGGNDLLELSANMINQGLAIKGGADNLDALAREFADGVDNYRNLLDDLTDYYELEQGYLKDQGAKGKKIHMATKRANRDLMKSYESFGKVIETFYQARFSNCVQKFEKRDPFSRDSCLLMLEAWDLNQAISKKRGEKKALKKYQKALLNLKKAERGSRAMLNSRNAYGQHTRFIGSAEDYLNESRDWINRKPPHRWKNRIPLPEAPLFVHMDLNFLLAAYKSMKQ